MHVPRTTEVYPAVFSTPENEWLCLAELDKVSVILSNYLRCGKVLKTYLNMSEDSSDTSIFFFQSLWRDVGIQIKNRSR